MGYQIPHGGVIEFVAEDGTVTRVREVIFRTDDGTEVNRLFCGRKSAVLTNELRRWQDNDPPKDRFISSVSPESWRCNLGGPTWNILREDGEDEELGSLLGSVAEDARQPGDYRGQVGLSLRGRGDAEPRLVWMASDAFTEDLFGTKQIVLFVRLLWERLWKFS